MLGPVTVTDLPAIDALIERCVLQSIDASANEKAYFLQRIRQNLAWWKDNPERAVHVQISANAIPVGVILVKNFWNLCHLFVDPSRQRTGIGSALVNAAIAQCRGRTTHPAIVVNSSRNAVAFYRSQGFVMVHDAPPPYSGLQFAYAFSRASEVQSAP
jgi:GNAT superfamily N-acetyltransferase